MGKTYDRIDARLKKFIEDQPMFFVATAPTAPDGYVNVSPKGYRDTFAVIDEYTFAYLDLFGSGVETIAHLRDTGRITVMFCSFGRSSNIVRLYGAGRVHRPDSPEFARYGESFNLGHPGIRAIIALHVVRVADSCGYSVPYMELRDERPVRDKTHDTFTAQDWSEYIATANARSIDGLPALDADHPLPTSIPR